MFETIHEETCDARHCALISTSACVGSARVAHVDEQFLTKAIWWLQRQLFSLIRARVRPYEKEGNWPLRMTIMAPLPCLSEREGDRLNNIWLTVSTIAYLWMHSEIAISPDFQILTNQTFCELAWLVAKTGSLTTRWQVQRVRLYSTLCCRFLDVSNPFLSFVASATKLKWRPPPPKWTYALTFAMWVTQFALE